MTVYLSEHIAPSAYKRLASHFTIVDNFDHPEDLDAIIVRRAHVTGDVIDRAKKLKIISMHGVGLDTIDVEAAQSHGVPVMNVPGGSAESVAELAVTYLMALSRKLLPIDRGLREGRYHHFGETSLIGTELYGKKLGLVGAGHIAGRVAEIMRGAFLCDVWCWNPHKNAEQLAAMGYKKMDTLEQLFHDMDMVSIHIPLTDSTRDLISYPVFENANPSLLLANTSRGGVVDEGALYDALTTGKIRAAASDVFVSEPPAKDAPLLTLDNFIATLHIGGSTNEALNRVSNAAVDHVMEVLCP